MTIELRRAKRSIKRNEARNNKRETNNKQQKHARTTPHRPPLEAQDPTGGTQSQAQQNTPQTSNNNNRTMYQPKHNINIKQAKRKYKEYHKQLNDKEEISSGTANMQGMKRERKER